MKWPTREADFLRIKAKLENYGNDKLPGLSNSDALEVFTEQIIASLRREQFYKLIQAKSIGQKRANPNHQLFDPERAVAHHLQQGQLDEACWLVFLMTHFARHVSRGWNRLREVYSLLGQGILTWEKFSGNPETYTKWISDNWQEIDVDGAFGNHRKYESLRPDSRRSTSKVLLSYLDLVGGSHSEFFKNLELDSSNDPFDGIYCKLKVLSFGRLAKFDYLMLLARYNILEITPRSAYLRDATGPKKGAKLLFRNDPNANISSADLQAKLDDLDNVLAVGMEVLEDAICNWQKSPESFIHFTG